MIVPSLFVAEDSVMTCEDYETNGPGIVQKAALLIAPLLASRPIRALARLLPQDVRKAIVTVLLTVANVLRR